MSTATSVSYVKVERKASNKIHPSPSGEVFDEEMGVTEIEVEDEWSATVVEGSKKIKSISPGI